MNSQEQQIIDLINQTEFAKVTVLPVKIVKHPNADLLDIAEVGLYQSQVRKGTFTDGELVAFIPEDSILTDEILKEAGLWDDDLNIGKLSGPKGNRLKTIKMRGIVSQGLVVKARPHWNLYDDVGKELSVKKWSPGSLISFTPQMAGMLVNAGVCTMRYDIENYKKHPNVIEEGEEVVMTEKIHGTWMCAGVYHPSMLEDPFIGSFLKDAGRYIVSSKGLSKSGLAFKYKDVNNVRIISKENIRTKPEYFDDMRPDDMVELFDELIAAPVKIGPINETNLYVATTERYKLFDICEEELKAFSHNAVFVLGEVIGVQDLTYGFQTATVTGDNYSGGDFRVFDVYYGVPGRGRFLDDAELDNFCNQYNLARCPVLYRGPFSRNELNKHTDGRETVSGRSLHIREGCVVRPTVERSCRYGRVQFKSVSTAYLLRKGNTTEYN